MDGFDPTGLTDVRTKLERSMTKRWVKTAREIKRAVTVDDVLGIGPKAPRMAMPAEDKAHLFKRWLDERLMLGVIGHDAGWLKPHVDAASSRAVVKSLRDFDPDEPRDDVGKWTAGSGGKGPGGPYLIPTLRVKGKSYYGASHLAAMKGLSPDLQREAVQADRDAVIRYTTPEGKLLGRNEARQYAEQNGLLNPRAYKQADLISEDLLSAAADPSHMRFSKGSSLAERGMTAVSPSTTDTDFAGAVKGLAGEKQAKFMTAAAEIDHGLGIDSQSVGVVGAWQDGAENTLVTKTQHASWDQLTTSAAMKAHLTNQKAALVFQSDPEGHSVLYSFHAKGEVGQIHSGLLEDGVSFHSLEPDADGQGATVHVADLDGSAYEGVAKSAERFNARVQFQFGKAAFIGSEGGEPTADAQRAAARKAYEGIIGESKVPGAGEVWARVHSGWGQALADGVGDEPRDERGRWTSQTVNYGTEKHPSFHDVTVLRNPTGTDLHQYITGLNKDQVASGEMPTPEDQLDLRVLQDDKGDKHVWGGMFATHDAMAKAMGLKGWYGISLKHVSMFTAAQARHAGYDIDKLYNARVKDAQANLGFLVAGAAPSAKVCHAASVSALATICDDVSQKAHSHVSAGLLLAQRPAQIARLLDQAFGEGLKRSRMLAEHAVTQAYSQATLDAMEARGVTHVGTISEHSHQLTDYDDKETRDPAGRWSSGTGGEWQAKSPEEQAAFTQRVKPAVRNATTGEVTVGHRGQTHKDLGFNVESPGDNERGFYDPKGGRFHSGSDVPLDSSDLMTPVQKMRVFGRDAEDEPRDERGRWTEGGRRAFLLPTFVSGGKVYRAKGATAHADILASLPPDEHAKLLNEWVKNPSIVRFTTPSGAILSRSDAFEYAEQNGLLKEPTGYRERELITEFLKPGATKPTIHDALQTAAGIMFVDPDDNALFLHRTDGQGWAWPGGGVEPPEGLEQGAVREAQEELGGAPLGPLTKIWRSTGHGVDFHTFSQNVNAPFTPTLNEEHDDWVWASPLDPPTPLHPGVAETLRGHGLIDAAEDEPRDARGRWTGEGATDEERAQAKRIGVPAIRNTTTGELHVGKRGKVHEAIGDFPYGENFDRGVYIQKTNRFFQREEIDLDATDLMTETQRFRVEMETLEKIRRGKMEDAARQSPQPQHPRTGQFAKAHVVARERRRSKSTGQFRRQGLAYQEQRKEELAEARFGRIKGKLDVVTAGDDKVCKRCDDISANGPYTINQARSLIPAHLHCRCLFTPARSMALDADDEPRDDKGRWTFGQTMAAERLSQINEYDRERFSSEATSGHLTFYHGAAADAVASIKQRGIVPHGGQGADAWYQAHGGSVQDLQVRSLPGAGKVNADRLGSVYITDDLGLAKGFANVTSSVHGTGAVVLKVAIPADRMKDVVHDELALSMPAYRFHGAIDPSWISVAAKSNKFRLKPEHQLAAPTLDAAPSLVLYLTVLTDEATSIGDFSPDQPRDESGKWSSGGVGAALGEAEAERAMIATPDTHTIDTPERHALRQSVEDSLYGKSIANRSHNRQATIILGLPAAGKSTIAQPLVDKGALEIDPDNAKAMLPEYNGGLGAYALHEESSMITRKVLQRALASGDDIVWPRIDSKDKIVADVNSLAKAGYKINVSFVDISEKDAITASRQRFAATGRYVSPKVIHGFGDSPRQAYEAALGTGLIASHAAYHRSLTSGLTKVGDAAVSGDDEWAKLYRARLDESEARDTEALADFVAENYLADFSPDEPRDESGRWTALSGSQGHPAMISSRNITAKKAAGAKGAYQRIDIDAMKQDPGLFKRNVDLFKNGDFYPGMRPDEVKGSPHEIADAVRNRMADNLEFLASTVSPENQKLWGGWYEGAHTIAQQNADKHGVDIASASGVIAALSPQNNWNANVYQAGVVMDSLKNKQGAKWDDKMSEVSVRIWKGALVGRAKEIEGKSLGELAGDDPESMGRQAMWIRTENEAHSDRSFQRVNTDGSLGETMRTQTGAPARAAWKATPSIVNAIAAFRSGGDNAKLGDAMGEKHKVRSFYNNILDPHSPNGDVTIDTHAVGAAWLTPSTGSDMSVIHDLGSNLMKGEQPKGYKATGKSAITGVSGTYGVYADAYRQAAKKLKMEPRQLQSIVWEAKQRLFSNVQTGPKIKEAVDSVWRKFHSGAISLQAAQREVVKVARETV